MEEKCQMTETTYFDVQYKWEGNPPQQNLYYVFNRCEFIIAIDPTLTFVILILFIKELNPIKAK